MFHGFDFLLLMALAIVLGFEFSCHFVRCLTISELVRDFVPAWLRWGFWIWLGVHFYRMGEITR
jgi:hypothetical protein